MYIFHFNGNMFEKMYWNEVNIILPVHENSVKDVHHLAIENVYSNWTCMSNDQFP